MPEVSKASGIMDKRRFFMLINLKQTASLLSKCRNAYILTHQSPDGDTISSAYGLYHILRRLGKRSKVLCSDEIPSRYSFLKEKYTDEDFEPEYIISVDVADRQLLGSLDELYGDRVNLCIDHHISNTGYAENVYLCAGAAANCENIYRISIELFGDCDDDTAECIYTGIVTDSGCFRYSCTNADTHRIASELMQNNKINYAWITRQMIEIKSKGRIELEYEIFKRAEYFLDDTCAVICVTLDLMNELGVKSQELEGIAGIMLQVEGVKAAVTMKEKEGGFFKISMRSPDDVNVSEICKTFGGGGHVNAAGCKIYGSAEDVKNQLVEAVQKYLEDKDS